MKKEQHDKTIPQLKIVATPSEIWQDNRYVKAKKRLFIGLVTGASALVCFFMALLWVIPYIGFSAMYSILYQEKSSRFSSVCAV